MRLAERHRGAVESHYTEGELDLEPPEELAIGELDDEAILEEELDNEDLLEEDVEEDTLEASLDDLVHGGDDDDADDAGLRPTPALSVSPTTEESEDEAEGEIGGDDLEESLDLVLLDRLALLDDGEDDAEAGLEGEVVVHSLLAQMQADTVDLVAVAPRRSDEFVCQSCFLVRKRVQLADTAAMACHDCSS
ncbi:MAG TPA: DUF4193 family protein [Acidimicrobiales bacterium]